MGRCQRYGNMVTADRAAVAGQRDLDRSQRFPLSQPCIYSLELIFDFSARFSVLPCYRLREGSSKVSLQKRLLLPAFFYVTLGIQDLSFPIQSSRIASLLFQPVKDLFLCTAFSRDIKRPMLCSFRYFFFDVEGCVLYEIPDRLLKPSMPEIQSLENVRLDMQSPLNALNLPSAAVIEACR